MSTEISNYRTKRTYLVRSPELEDSRTRNQWSRRGFGPYGVCFPTLEHHSVVWVGNEVDPKANEVSVLAHIAGLGYDVEDRSFSDKQPLEWFAGVLPLAKVTIEGIESDPYAIALRALEPDVLSYNPTTLENSFKYLNVLLPIKKLACVTSAEFVLQPSSTK